jgi:hypothetical protein
LLRFGLIREDNVVSTQTVQLMTEVKVRILKAHFKAYVYPDRDWPRIRGCLYTTNAKPELGPQILRKTLVALPVPLPTPFDGAAVTMYAIPVVYLPLVLAVIIILLIKAGFDRAESRTKKQ